MTRPSHHRQSGFTLLELMMVLLIAGLIMGVGVPGFQQMAYNGKRLSLFQQMYASLQTARLEAITRSTNVTVCKRNTGGTACLNSAAWNDGWIIFVDTDGDGVVDAGDDILRVFDDIGADMHVEGDSNAGNRVTFDLLGRTAQTGTLAICDPRGHSFARGVVVEASGRARAWESGTDTAFDANDCS